MRDAVPFALQLERFNGLQSKRQRLDFIQRHAGAGAGKIATAIEAVGIDLAGIDVARPQRRKPVGDAGALGHPVEHRARPGIGQQRAREGDERRMDVVRPAPPCRSG